MLVLEIPVHYDPRPYQLDFMRAMESGKTFAVLEWARRAGKDMTCFAYAIKKMVATPMNVVLVFPTKQQGYDSFWKNVENDGFKTIDHIPKSMVASRTNSVDNMQITLKNGSTFSVLGAQDPEALRGANGKIYILSEFVDIDSAVLGVIRPIVAVNGGQIIIQSTPKQDGISGGTFLRLFKSSSKNPRHYTSKIDGHHYLTDEQLEQVRQEYIDQYGNDFLFRQEFLLDEGAATSKSYYGNVLDAMTKNKHIGSYPWDKKYPVYTAWDLGTSDSTAIIFFQYYGKQLYIIDAYETHDIGYKPIVAFLKQKNYDYKWHFLPWDGNTREQSDATVRIEKLRDLGLTNSSTLTREVVEDGINRVVTELPHAVINEPMVSEMLEKLPLYQRKYNPITGDYMGPEHKTESHIADALRYLFAAIEQEFNKETCEMYYTAQASEQTYESEEVVTSLYEPQDW